MTLSLTLGVDYDELAAHLQKHHQLCSADDPLPTTAFKYYRDVLDQHVEEMMDADAYPSDPELTNILLRQYSYGHITEITVTRAPGCVATNGKSRIALPLVIISFTI